MSPPKARKTILETAVFMSYIMEKDFSKDF